MEQSVWPPSSSDPASHRSGRARHLRGPVSRWLDRVAEESGSSRWSLALHRDGNWTIETSEPSLHDPTIAALVRQHARASEEAACILDVQGLNGGAERLAASGIARLLLLPISPDARLVLENADEDRERWTWWTQLTRGLDLKEALANDALPPWEQQPGTDAGMASESHRNSLLRERARIASVIHEGITQVLTNIAVNLEVLRHVADDPDTTRELVAASRKAVLEALESLRTVIFDLTPTEEEWTDLVKGLEGFIADLNAQWGTKVTASFEGDPRDLDPEVISLTFAFVQEALTNVRRHAGTDIAQVKLTFGSDHLNVEVKDEGRGIQERSDQDLRLHQGLKIMESRVRLLSGQLTVRSSPGEGTCVRMLVPA